jgi:hypothetical protein
MITGVVVRAPQRLLSSYCVSDAEVRYRTAGELKQFFVCTECKGYLRKPYTTKCCLTSFCSDCLVRQIYTPAGLCPNCGK